MSAKADNPEFRRYYQGLTDLIAVFWQYHLQSIKEGKIAFAAMKNELAFRPSDDEKWLPFKAQAYLENHVVEDPSGDGAIIMPRMRADLITAYNHGIHHQMVVNWQQFLHDIREQSSLNHQVKSRFEGGMAAGVGGSQGEIGSTSRSKLGRFTSGPWIRNPVAEVAHLGSRYSRTETNSGAASLEEVVRAGTTTGLNVVTTLLPMGKIFERYDLARAALILSKVSLGNAGQVQKEITKAGNYALIDEEQGRFQHLDVTKLKEYGLGEVLGCPAGLPVSPECRDFLESRCGVEVEGTMLSRLAETVKVNFQKDVQDWFDSRTEREQEIFLNRDNVMLLRGEKPWSYHSESQRELHHLPHKEARG